MKNTATYHTSRDKEWIDESGVSIPYNRTTKAERLHERSSARILKSAISLNKKLSEFKNLIRKLSDEAYKVFMKEKNSKTKTKGNFTWYNFDRSIKIEVSISEPIRFDDLTIEAAKSKFDEFLDQNIESKNDFVKEMITDAFETQRSGKMDVKQVMNLSRYESKINDPLFSEAVALINQAVRKPKSKTYFRVWQKDEHGEYQNVDLNLSSI
ncbi:DUF3164 family protein [Winogradskyella luteola]|uniref:DUF3164 family protein n=1 Tax=Winogradskyella luteola TaxID=2828330 RepID=A0A9X1F781_9FLAO|nr:DUF3164 family protein [Winogradskyella luteola]MBV7268401.1 DUF3164 family protein [Winogradskyella luteola]